MKSSGAAPERRRAVMTRLKIPAICAAPGHATPVRRDWQPGQEKSQDIDAVLQVVISLGKTRIHLLPDLLSNEAAAGDPDGQFVQRVRQVNGSTLAERVGELPGLLEHDAGIPAHRGIAQGRVQEPELFAHDVRGDVISHPASEDGHRELVHGPGFQLLLRRPEIEIVCFGSGEQVELAGTEPETHQVAVLTPAPVKHRHRVPVKLQQVTEQRPSSREFRYGFRGPRRGLIRRQGRGAVGAGCHTCPQ